MKTRWILASLTLMITTAAATFAAEARPGERDGQKAPRIVSDRYTDGYRVLEFRGTPREDGTMTVGIEFRRGSEAPSRVLVGTRRFKSYESALTAFFNPIEPEFLGLFRARLPEVFRTAMSQIDAADGGRAKDRIQLVLTELGAFQYARKSMVARGVRDIQGAFDCTKIGVGALAATGCVVEVPLGAIGWSACVAELVNYGFDINDVEGCIDYIMQLICESNGYPWKWIPGSGGYSDKCIECFDQDAHACDMVVSGLDSPLEGGHEPDNQNPDEGGGGWEGGFSYVWGSDGGTVVIQTCYCIELPDGTTYVVCH